MPDGSILVNNAVRDYRPIPFSISRGMRSRDLDVVGKGAFLCCQHVIPLMLAQGEEDHQHFLGGGRQPSRTRPST